MCEITFYCELSKTAAYSMLPSEYKQCFTQVYICVSVWHRYLHRIFKHSTTDWAQQFFIYFSFEPRDLVPHHLPSRHLSASQTHHMHIYQHAIMTATRQHLVEHTYLHSPFLALLWCHPVNSRKYTAVTLKMHYNCTGVKNWRQAKEQRQLQYCAIYNLHAL